MLEETRSPEEILDQAFRRSLEAEKPSRLSCRNSMPLVAAKSKDRKAVMTTYSGRCESPNSRPAFFQTHKAPAACSEHDHDYRGPIRAGGGA